jgi:hypothetical protein
MTGLAVTAALAAMLTGQAPISVVAGTYGGNCGVRRGQHTGSLAETCNGKLECSYRIDVKVLGDPSFGCGKSYLAEWRCGAKGKVHTATAPAEAGLGAVLTLACPPLPEPYQAPPPRPAPPPPPLTSDPVPRPLPRDFPPDDWGPLKPSTPRRPPGHQGIFVVEGTAGTSCGLPSQTSALAAACNGKHRCEYTLSVAPMDARCPMDFVAKWQCGDEDRASSRLVPPGSKSVTLSCEPPAPAPAPPPKGVRLVSATYGGNCGAPAGNVSAVVAAACNGKSTCPYVVDWTVIGDPAYGCGKDFVVQWRCAGSAKTATVRLPGEAGFKKTALISCQ